MVDRSTPETGLRCPFVVVQPRPLCSFLLLPLLVPEPSGLALIPRSAFIPSSPLLGLIWGVWREDHLRDVVLLFVAIPAEHLHVLQACVEPVLGITDVVGLKLTVCGAPLAMTNHPPFQPRQVDPPVALQEHTVKLRCRVNGHCLGSGFPLSVQASTSAMPISPASRLAGLRRRIFFFPFALCSAFCTRQNSRRASVENR